MPQESSDTDSRKKRIFLVDDHPLVREWLATLVNQQSDLSVCGEAANASEGIDLIVAAKPDVAVVDIAMERRSGIELIKSIKAACPEVAVVVLTMHDEMLYAERALCAGARGYVMKREANKNVLQAIRRVLEGKFYVSRKIAAVMAGKWVEGKPAGIDSVGERLSSRELEVFRLLGRGLGTRQIATEMCISFNTVQSFCARIKEKLQLLTAAELLREAIRWHDSRQDN